MTFVRFGRRVINMDQVVEIEYRAAMNQLSLNTAEHYRLYTNVTVDGLPNWIEVDGADIIALEMWIDDNSHDARAPMMEVE